jgi:hypothetical protein
MHHLNFSPKAPEYIEPAYKENEPKIILVQWQLMMPKMSLKLKKITLTSSPISFNTEDKKR